MKRWFVLGAAALMLGSLVADDASAQRRGFGGFGGGAVRMGNIGGGPMRMAGPGLRGGMGTVGIGGPGIRTAGLGVRTAGLGVRSGVRYAGWRGRWGGGRGWGFPLAVGFGLGYAGSYYNDCLAWDGYQWVNVCYSPYYGYGYW